MKLKKNILYLFAAAALLAPVAEGAPLPVMMIADNQSQSAEQYIMEAEKLMNAKKYEEAIDKCKQAIEINPNLPDPYLYWGYSLHQTGYHKESIDKFKKTIELDNQNDTAYYLWGQALAEMGAFKRGSEKIKEATIIAPNNLNYHIGRGILLENIGFNGEASQEYAIALKLVRDEDEKTTIREHLTESKKKDAGAKKKAEIETRLTNAKSLVKAKKYSEAITEYEKVLKLDPKNIFALVFHGDLLAASGNKSAAMKEYKLALEIARETNEINENDISAIKERISDLQNN